MFACAFLGLIFGVVIVALHKFLDFAWWVEDKFFDDDKVNLTLEDEGYGDKYEQLEKINELKEKGILAEKEFKIEKNKILKNKN